MFIYRNIKSVLLLFFVMLLPFALLGLFFSLNTAVAGNSSFIVNSFVDADDINPGDGLCDGDAGTSGEQCTLRAAISEANAAAQPVTITIPAGTFTLEIAGIKEDMNATGDLDIAQNMNLIGAGRDDTIIQAGATLSDSVDRVFHITNSPTAVSFADLTIQHGYIANTGVLTGQIDDGAGLLVIGNPNTAVSLQNVKVSNNLNLDLREDGAGIANLGGGTVTIRDSEISNNQTRLEPGSSGAGLFSVFGSSMIIHNTIISGNMAGGKGGGIYTNLDGSEIHIVNSVIANNYAADIGGGIQSGSIVVITNSTVSGNETSKTGGGISNDSPNSRLTLNFVTISNNRADRDDLGVDNGGGLHLISGTITMTNSIVAGNWMGPDTPNDCAVDKPIAASYSLVDVMSNCSLTGTNNLTATNPLLLPFASTGTNTFGHLLSDASPVRDLVPDGVNGCGDLVTTDQRGTKRPYNAACDLGAFEWLPSIYLPIIMR